MQAAHLAGQGDGPFVSLHRSLDGSRVKLGSVDATLGWAGFSQGGAQLGHLLGEQHRVKRWQGSG